MKKILTGIFLFSLICTAQAGTQFGHNRNYVPSQTVSGSLSANSISTSRAYLSSVTAEGIYSTKTITAATLESSMIPKPIFDDLDATASSTSGQKVIELACTAEAAGAYLILGQLTGFGTATTTEANMNIFHGTGVINDATSLLEKNMSNGRDEFYLAMTGFTVSNLAAGETVFMRGTATGDPVTGTKGFYAGSTSLRIVRLK